MRAPRLFASLYLDEDVDVLLADLVRGQGGFGITTARDEDMLGRKDYEHLSFAVEQQRVLVTHNREDFEELARAYFEEGRTHWGIICAFRRPLHEIVRRLLVVLNDRTASEFKDHLLYV